MSSTLITRETVEAVAGSLPLDMRREVEQAVAFRTTDQATIAQVRELLALIGA